MKSDIKKKNPQVQEQQTSNSVTEHTDDMVIHTDLVTGSPAEKMYFNVQMGVTQLTFFLLYFF